MSLGTANRDGGKTSESGHLRALSKAFRGDVSNGLAVSQRGAGANMSVDIAIGDAFVPRSDGTYSHPVFNDAVLNQAIATADPSNPRRDIVVLYVDYGNSVSTAVSNNTNGVVKVKVVAGTPAGSPSDPTDTAIQTSVGAGNPFIKLARVRVGAGVSSVGNSVIDDLRRLATAHAQGGWLYEYLYTWVYVSATSFKIAGVDATAGFPVGTKIQLYQGGVVKYFTVSSATFSTDTTVNIYDSNATYTLANLPIDRPAYSYMDTPVGFPLSVPLPPRLLGNVEVLVGDTTYVNTATYVDLVGLTGVAFTTTKPNQKVMIIAGAQTYGQAGRWKPLIDGVDAANYKKVGFGPATTYQNTCIFIATVATPGAHTLKIQIQSDTSGHRIIHSEGAGTLMIFAM